MRRDSSRRKKSCRGAAAQRISSIAGRPPTRSSELRNSVGKEWGRLPARRCGLDIFLEPWPRTPAPTALRPAAQGWRAAPTLGISAIEQSTPTGLRQRKVTRCHQGATSPLRLILRRRAGPGWPRCAGPPWAEGRSPVGAEPVPLSSSLPQSYCFGTASPIISAACGDSSSRCAGSSCRRL